MAAARVTVETRQILSGQTGSEAFDAGLCESGTFTVPALTGTTLQPQMSNDNTNWTNVGSAISVSTNGTYELPALMFKARYGRLVSNSSEASSRTITLGLKR